MRFTRLAFLLIVTSVIPSISYAIPAPRGLAVESFRESAILSWQPVDTAVCYEIETSYGITPSAFQTVAQVPAIETAYRHEMVSGALNYFRVVAVDQSGARSRASNTVQAMRLVRPWGIAVLPDGSQLIRDPGSRRTLGTSASSIMEGPVGAREPGFTGCYDLAVDFKGRILSAICASKDSAKAGFIVQDRAHRVVVAVTAEEGTEPGRFRQPMGIGADTDGHIFVADTLNSRVQEFTPEGKFVRIIGEGELRLPMKVAFDADGRLYVADSGNNRIAVYERLTEGGFKLQKDLKEGIKEPCYVTVSPTGQVYVSTNRVAGVYRFNLEGKIDWSYKGTAQVGLSGPRGLALTRSGNLHIVDEATQRVLTVTPVVSASERKTE